MSLSFNKIKNIKILGGNTMRVKAGKIPGMVQEVELREGATIADVLREANLDVAGHEIRLNGTQTDNFNIPVSEGNIVLLAKKIKGNSDVYSVKMSKIIEDGSTETLNDYYYTSSTSLEDLMDYAEISTIGLQGIKVVRPGHYLEYNEAIEEDELDGIYLYNNAQYTFIYTDLSHIDEDGQEGYILIRQYNEEVRDEEEEEYSTTPYRESPHPTPTISLDVEDEVQVTRAGKSICIKAGEIEVVIKF